MLRKGVIKTAWQCACVGACVGWPPQTGCSAAASSSRSDTSATSAAVTWAVVDGSEKPQEQRVVSDLPQ